MTTIAVIPCRYTSTRLPGKPLLAETGKTLVQHVYENVLRCKSIDHVVVAADDERILSTAKSFGADIKMTSSHHLCGSDRVAEVAAQMDGDIFVNVQGDEPELDPEFIDGAVKLLAKDKKCGVSTICSPMDDQAELEDPHTVKCVVNANGFAMYFSRASIPFPRLVDRLARPETSILLKHQGVYCFRKKTLLEFSSLESPAIESFEGLEQLRLLWHGYPIRVFMSGPALKGIDTPQDYDLFVKRMERAKRRGRRKR